MSDISTEEKMWIDTLNDVSLEKYYWNLIPSAQL